MSNPYGSHDPYGQQGPDPHAQQPPAADPQQQHDLYGQMTGYTPAGSSQSAPDPYGHDEVNPYAEYSDPTPAPGARRSPVLGIVALVLVVIGVVVSLAMAIIGGNALASIVDQLGTTDLPADIPPGLEGQYATYGLTTIVYFATALPILAGLIMGIVSIATARGRLFGILATVLAVVGPIIVGIVFLVIVGPAAAANTPGL